ncbi:MAG: hypothetical protein HY875_02470 [Chloroflexi bacterium]|nr:hypothetical protein [Chloroflexota bacterium]
MSGQPDPARRIFVSYIDKSRDYYEAQGYGNPYRWAYNTAAPFTPLPKPLADSRVGIVTTASLIDDNDPGPEPFSMPRVVYSAPVDPPPASLYTMHRSWDKEATHTDDLGSFFPLQVMRDFAIEGRIAGVSARFYGVPTQYSQRQTIASDAPEILRLCREDGVDVALLVAL